MKYPKRTEALRKYWLEYKAKFGKRPSYVRTKEHRLLMGKIKSKQIITPEWRENISKNHADVSGNKNPMWGKTQPEYVKEAVRRATSKGGVTPINLLIRRSYAYLKWRKQVFERDRYTCQFCGAHTGNGHRVTLNADHVKSFALYPELRFEISNGRTLCLSCHRKTDNFGKNLPRKDFAYA
jgi:predicted restriction endonuclease